MLQRSLIRVRSLKQVLGVLFIFLCIQTYAQKETLQTIDAKNISEIIISSDEVFKITLATTKDSVVTMKTESEGEYFQNISITTNITGKTLTVSSQYPEILTSGFDKLSAHKVFAVQVFLKVPENLNVTIISNVASVFGSGSYKKLELELKSGQCVLSNFNGNLLVNTYNGNIIVETNYAKVEAESRHGNVQNTLKHSGENLLKLKTIDGDISVTQSQ